MILKELLEVLSGPDEILIVREAEKEADEEIIYKGYKGLPICNLIPAELMDETVTKFSFYPEIRHKEWEKRGLMPPIDPEKTPNFKYKDLQIIIYYKITLKGGPGSGGNESGS